LHKNEEDGNVTNQVPFIPRSEITDAIEAAIHAERGSRKVICIQAEGGIGKTRLLQEVYRAQQPVVPSMLPGGYKHKEIFLKIIKEFATSEWDEQFWAGASAMSKDLGIGISQENANLDFERMADLLESERASSTNAVIVGMGNDERIAEPIRRLVESGKIVLTHDNYLKTIPIECLRVFQDHQNACRVLALKMFEDLNYRGKIALVSDESPIQKQRRKSLEEELNKAPNIQVVAEFGRIGENMVEDIRQQTFNVLQQHPDLRAFWVGFDEMARGVVLALIELKRKDVSVYSFDLNPSSMKLMLQRGSPWKATVAVNPREIGRLFVRLATAAVYGEELKSQYSLSMELITQDSLRQRAGNFDDVWGEKDLPQLIQSDLIQTLQISKLEQQRGWQVLPIIDFDDHRYRIPINVGRFIADNLEQGEHLFRPYLQALSKLHRQEDAQADPNVLSAMRDQANQAFINCFNQVSHSRRVVLLFDTTEKLKDSDVYNYLLNLCRTLQNVVLIFAGRKAIDIGNALYDIPADDISSQLLNPLDEVTARLYLHEKLMTIHQRDFSEETVNKIIYLARGRPILIDIAVEWVVRGASPQWIKGSFKELQDQIASSNEPIKEFERQLVLHIADTRQEIDWLWLLMACVYPLDTDMAAMVHSPSEEKPAMQQLCRDAAKYVFVKTLPDGRLALHDEMQRMIMEYVWPRVDRMGQRRKLYYQRAADYLQSQANELNDNLHKLKDEEKKLGTIGNLALEISAQIETDQRELWVLREQQLHYVFQVSFSDGVELFGSYFDQAEKETDYAMELLLQEAERHLNVVPGQEAAEQQTVDTLSQEADINTPDITFEQEYKIRLRRARYLSLTRQYKEAVEKLGILRQKTTDTSYLIDILLLMAHCKRLLGYPQETVNLLESALGLCSTNDELYQRQRGNVLNALGLVHRQLGEWEQAEVYYKDAIKLIQKTGDRANLANAYNNLGYVTGLKSDYASALRWSQRAFEIQKELGDKAEFDRGRTHNVLGVIYRHKEDFGSSYKHIDQALTIFTRLDKPDWIARALLERGTTKYHQDQLEDAAKDLVDSLQLAHNNHLEIELPKILHYLGHVLWEQKQYEAAENYFTESIEAGEKVGDIQQIINSYEGLVELYYYRGFYDKNEEAKESWYSKAKETAIFWENKYDREKIRFPLYTGSRLRVLGNIAFDQGNYNEALDYYLQAYPYIARRGGYSRYMLPKALDWLSERLAALPPQVALDWCDNIDKKWGEEELSFIFPEMLTTSTIARDNAQERLKDTNPGGGNAT
jgi:simple sugar transport system substrate-binding protein